MSCADRRNARCGDRCALTMIEQALSFECAGDVLIGIVSIPERTRDIGVLVIVGGPQYRVGSHRQFVLLARRLARQGFATMRFDYRGMGDSSGTPRPFDQVSDDIDAAIAAFRRACPAVAAVVLWGLCDAASAALIYVDARRSAPVAGMVLANPWVRSGVTIAKAQIRHYYAARIFERTFWAKLVRGEVGMRHALRGFVSAAQNATRASDRGAPRSFQERMASGLSAFHGQVLIVSSGRDLTAREFDDYSRADPAWRALLARKTIDRCDIEDSDHTFSSDASRDRVETATMEWLERRVAGAV